MKYIFEVKTTQVIDADQFYKCETEEHARGLLSLGYGEKYNTVIELVEVKED